MKTAAVVVNSGGPNGYGVIVNLGRKGVPVFSVDSNPYNNTFFSKFATKVICPDYNISKEKFLKFLLDLGRSINPKPVLFITNDLQLLCVLERKEEFEKFFHLPMASKEIVDKLVDKSKFYKELGRLKLPFAETYTPKDINEVKEISREIKYPFIIKPVQSKTFPMKFGNKCLEVNSGQELLETYRKVALEEDDIIVQKRIGGSERYLVYTYFDQNAVPLAVSCYKKSRIYPIDYGNACMCEIFWEPEAINLCITTLKKIQYKGLAEAEIQRDENDGQLKLVEINARTTTEAKLSAKLGLNMEFIAYKDILGLPIRLKPIKIKNLKWYDTIRDLLSVFSPDGYLANGKISIKEWAKSLIGNRSYADFSKDDPFPFFISSLFFIKNNIVNKHIFMKVYRVITKTMTKNKKNEQIKRSNLQKFWPGSKKHMTG